MIANSVSSTQTVRNVFIIDNNGIVRTILIYPLTIGRCIPEILRIIQALQMADCSNGVIPANWIPNDPIIEMPPKSINNLHERVNYIEKNKNGMSWYLSFKKPECKSIEENKKFLKDECK